MNESEFAELSAGAALHALTAEDERHFRRALAENPAWQRIVDADIESAALLADAPTPEAPPAGIRADLLTAIAATPQRQEPDVRSDVEPDAAPAAESPRRHPRTAVIFALAACLALIVGIGVGTIVMNLPDARPASVVALEDIRAADDASQASVDLPEGTATAHWSPDLGKAVLVTDGIAQPDTGMTYELWFVRDGAPVSAGVFDVESGSAVALLQGDFHSGDVIAVTLEESGGSPSGQPTSDPVIVIPTA